MRMHSVFGVLARAAVVVVSFLLALAQARAAEITLADGSVWKGDVGAKVRVVYSDGVDSVPFDGVVAEVAEGFVLVKGIDGSLLRLIDITAGSSEPSSSSKPSTSKPSTSRAAASKPSASKSANDSTVRRWIAVFELEDLREASASGFVSTPRVYVVPLEGQIGTDVCAEIVDELLRDIKRFRPDILVFRMNCADLNRINHLADDRIEEAGIPDPEMIRDMVKRFQEEVPNARQVVWIQDAVGVSSLMAMAWNEMYCTPDMRIGGVARFMARVEEMWSDPDVRSKMLAAQLGLFTGLVVQGGHAECIAEAMLIPERKLSLDFTGRSVRWRGDDKGLLVVDSSEKDPTNMLAEAAEITMLCDGVAETLEDLLFLLGEREYRLVGRGERIVQDHKAAWRKALESALDAMEQAAQTDDDIAGLGRRRNYYEKVVGILKRYPFLELRQELRQRGIGTEVLEYYIDDIRKIIQRLNEAEKDAKRGGGQGGSPRGPGGGLGSPRG